MIFLEVYALANSLSQKIYLLFFLICFSLAYFYLKTSRKENILSNIENTLLLKKYLQEKLSLSFISRQEDIMFSWISKLSAFPIWNHYIFGNFTMKTVYFHGKWKAGFSFKISRRKLYIFYENKRGKDGQYKNKKCLALKKRK